MLHPRLITRELRPILSTLKLAYFSDTDQIIDQILIYFVAHCRATGLQSIGVAGRWGYRPMDLSICTYIDISLLKSCNIFSWACCTTRDRRSTDRSRDAQEDGWETARRQLGYSWETARRQLGDS